MVANLGKCLRSQKWSCFSFAQLTLDSVSEVPMLLMLSQSEVLVAIVVNDRRKKKKSTG